VDSGFEAELARLIREKTGAANVKMKTSVRPELLGGYRLRIGGFYIDASLKGQLAKMKADLEAVI
jgi:F0F1-type ATP synthase delta subunit